ncbi:Rqc2 family fibronectin-binding protein [Acetobacterium sp. UBA5834]|jgi:predicted ribosome quality control (RQC) complex YloA/Tae2 family protein|uniref:Rqc2 family fibronectin-binding protein n=1 Tax=Acetobacterium sp. UBA5834 TaxID=1945907 RepID=UPI002579ED94|nr:NFACT RNA binding domain-containing protein [Acetobacterium sp. UBA5834]
MAYDGVTLYHLINEFKPLLIGGRIRKIYQPEIDEIRLLVNLGNQKKHLLLSANASNPRVYMTEKIKENPSAAPSFCMVLRKYLLNGTIIDIAQHETDRIMELSVTAKNDFNEIVVRKLLVEIMGRNSNIILVDESMKILDSLKKVGSTSSRYRQILPGRDYVYPPENSRLSFLNLDANHLNELLSDYKDSSVEKVFVQALLGISPNISREIAFRSGIDPQTSVSGLSKKQKQFLCEAFTQVINEIRQKSEPVIIYLGRKMVDFSTIDLHYLRSDHRFEAYPSISEMLEAYYFMRDKALRFKTRAANLRQQLDILVRKNIKKLDNLQQDVDASHKNEKFKLYGDLITANIYAIEKGQEIATLVNYYDPDCQTIDIPLKVNRTPAQNAQHYYKKYNKSKTALKHLASYILETEEKIYYLESLVNSLEQSTELAELDEIRHEFLHSEFNKKAISKEDKKKQLPSKPLHYISSEGFHIFVGKNNYQNDFISTKMGKNEDCWLHVKDAPGSHVLIVAGGRFITEKTLLEAGNLAAWFSKSRGSSNVPVDYLEFKYLKKPSKAKPGMVVFTNQNTMYVTPTQDGVESIEVITDTN